MILLLQAAAARSASQTRPDLFRPWTAVTRGTTGAASAQVSQAAGRLAPKALAAQNHPLHSLFTLHVSVTTGVVA